MTKKRKFDSCLTVLAGLALLVGVPSAQAAEALALQKIMKDLGRNMQEAVGALAREDFEALEKAGLAIADHPSPPFTEKARVLAFVGSNMGKFKSYDNDTHESARAMAKAAREKDGLAAIEAFRSIQTGCYNCHHAFRKPFVEHFYGKPGG